MKKEKIEELFKKYSTFSIVDNSYDNVMDLDDFSDAIDQAELEWYEELKNRLNKMATECNIVADIFDYQLEIQNKIKELEK